MRTPEGMDLFEVYEAGGTLLYVSSYLDLNDPPGPTDVVYRRPWATAAKAQRRLVGGGWGDPE